jgi:hypothetical protein
MAADKVSQENQAKIKSLAKDMLELLAKLAPVPSAVQAGWKIAKETEKSLSMAGRTWGSNELSASDDNINRLQEIANRLSDELSTLNRKTANWWIDSSGANLFSVKDSTKAIIILDGQRKTLVALRAACDGLKALTAVAFANTVADVKGLAKIYAPSIPLIDAEVTKEVREQFDICKGLIDDILSKLDKATFVIADMNKQIDRFLTLIKTKDQRETVRVIEAGKAKPSEATAR